jgi:hypothetical protein
MMAVALTAATLSIIACSGGGKTNDGSTKGGSTNGGGTTVSADGASATTDFGAHLIVSTRNGSGVTSKLTVKATGEEFATIQWDASMKKVQVQGPSSNAAPMMRAVGQVTLSPAIQLGRLNTFVEKAWTRAANGDVPASPQSKEVPNAGNVRPLLDNCVTENGCTDCNTFIYHDCPQPPPPAPPLVGECTYWENDETCPPNATITTTGEDCSSCQPSDCPLDWCHSICESSGLLCESISCSCV